MVVVTDVHLGGRAAPALLKTLEEPPGATVFVLLADDVAPELATVASRCVQIAFPPVPRPDHGGVARSGAAWVPMWPPWWPTAAGGTPSRARVMIEDADVAARAALWSSVPDQLNGTGVVAAELARGLLASAERAVEPLRAEHARELERLTEEAAEFGEKALPGPQGDHRPPSTRGTALAHRCPPGRAGCPGPGLPGPDDGTGHRG